MHSHLTSEEMEHLLHDPKARAASLHLQVCTACVKEIDQLASAFADLRATATEIALEHRRRAILPAPGRAHSGWVYASAAGFALAVAVVPLTLHHSRTAAHLAQQPVPQVRQTISDEALLNSIQDDLSASVPAAMEPLATTSGQSTPAVSKTD